MFVAFLCQSYWKYENVRLQEQMGALCFFLKEAHVVGNTK